MTETLAQAVPVAGADLYGRRRKSSLLLRIALGAAHNPITTIAVLFLVVEVAMAIFAGQFSTASQFKTNLLGRLHGPTSAHYFGTDSAGRDLYTRVLFGARYSLTIAALTVMLAVLIGSTIGISTGYLGGALDLVFQRIIDTLQAFPGLVLALLIISIFGTGRYVIIIPLVVLFVPSIARVVRASVIGIRNRDFITACQTLGASPLRVMARHILPNVFSTILVVATLLFGAAIIIESSLSFLGLGLQAPNPALGNILASEGRPHMAQHPYLAVIPILAISLTVLAVNIAGDTLRDALDPSLRNRR